MSRYKRFLAVCVMLAGVAPAFSFAAKARRCFTADQASTMLNEDVCVSAHVYDVVRLPDGTRFLDVCPPATPDASCRFTIVSFAIDRDAVGELARFRDTNVQIRGIVRPMRGRSEIVLSHVRQFYGGPPRFRPNPNLLRGVSADTERPPVADPNLHTHGRARAFMNSRDQETRPAK
jgi:hypothetical protein